MAFFDPTKFDPQAAKQAMFSAIPEGEYRIIITKAEPTRGQTGDMSKYPGRWYDYLQFECDVLMPDGGARSYSERFMTNHEMADHDSFKGLVAGGQTRMFELYQALGLAGTVVPDDQINSRLSGQMLMARIGLKKKETNYPNYIAQLKAMPNTGHVGGTTPAQPAMQPQPDAGLAANQNPYGNY
ncbi:hypothetical protein [Bowmanella sp. JS7-9]|uniref:DUF669 domain-containing protein n=1 Tax=Pseudobowmanella zhangzhouensis TaxID=1537679 RepID=A0ABW1XNV8_9ALTE|nr:hypothetical protein [Bowmanella sp. JS7-9]TBX21949.1 hypothetical protein TK45_10715 [Bowmanella sp. JS7-9]